MTIKLFSTFCLVFYLSLSYAQSDQIDGISMWGIKINDSKKSLEPLKSFIDVEESKMVKYKTKNGNDFSVTIEKNKIVYMENDWLHEESGSKPLYSDFTFGKTSLKDIRAKFGTNGFTHRTRGPMTTDTDLIMFNCFEFDSANNEILVVITKTAISDKLTEENLAENCKLDALIIASKDYLDKTWGKEKAFDKKYSKIKP